MISGFGTFEFFLLAFIVLYIALTRYLARGLKPSSIRSSDYEPFVSIVVSAKDEEQRISACLQSLLAVDYPAEKMEIIITDDRSTDRTAEVVESVGRTDSRVRLLRHTEQETGPLRGKQRALAFGLRQCRGEIILLTDADCRVPPTWVRSMVSQFDANTGVVGGYTLTTKRDAHAGVLERLQSTIALYLLSLAAGAAGNGTPISAIGTNLAYRKSAYDEVGGYERLPFSLVEDMVLVKTVAKRTRWRMRFSLQPDGVVITEPAATIRDLVHQLKRWTVGASVANIRAKLWDREILLLTAGFGTHLLLLAGLFLATEIWLPLAGIAVVSLADYFFLSKAATILQRRDVLGTFVVFKLFYFFYLLAFPFLLLSAPVTWKGTRYY